jgi:hypothetical protein
LPRYPPMNKLYIGFTKAVELPKGGCLLIDDEVRDIPRARIFDPLNRNRIFCSAIGRIAGVFYGAL